MKKIYIFIVLVIVVLLGSIGWLSINYLSGTKSSEQEQIEQKLTQLEKHNKELEGKVKKLDQKGSSISSSEKLESSNEESSVQETTIESQVSGESETLSEELIDRSDKGYGNKQIYTVDGFEIIFDYPVNDVDWIGFQDAIPAIQGLTQEESVPYLLARDKAFQIHFPHKYINEVAVSEEELINMTDLSSDSPIFENALRRIDSFQHSMRIVDVGKREIAQILLDNYESYQEPFEDYNYPYYVLLEQGGIYTKAIGIGTLEYDAIFETNFSGKNSENNSRDMRYLIDEYYSISDEEVRFNIAKIARGGVRLRDDDIN